MVWAVIRKNQNVQMEIVLNSIEIKLNAENGNTPPEQIQLLPKSPVTGRDGRKFKYKPETVLEGFKQHAQKLPIDLDHESELGGKTAASGWIKSLEAKEDGIYGNVKWNKKGKQLLEDEEYSYLSPAFFTNDDKEIQYLSSAALTNHPNFKMPALNAINHNCTQQGETMELIAIATALDLPAQSEAGAIINSIHKLKTNQLDTNNFVPKADYELVLNQKQKLETELNQLKSEDLTKEANSIVDKAIAEGRISNSSKNYYLNNCSTKEGLDNTKAFLESCPALSESILANKENKPNGTAANQLSEVELNMIKDSGITAEEFIASKKQLNA